VLFSGGVYFKRDVHLVWHPQVESLVRAVHSGSPPLWDPDLAFGQPLLGDPSAQIAYPLTWLNLLMRPWLYYTLFVVVHFLLAATGMRRLARHLGLSPLASTVASLVFVLSGPYLSMVDLWHHFAGASWLPWVVLAADRALDGGRRETATFGAVLALQIVAGSADLVAMSLLLAAVVGVAPRFTSLRAGGRAGLLPLARAGLGLLLALGASALLWMPSLDLVSRAARSQLPEAVRTYWSVHPAVAVETVLPGLLSALPLHRDLRAAFFESREPFLASLYLGTGVVALAVGAVAASRHRLRLPLLALLSITILVALGAHTPVYGLVTTIVPPLRILRYPVKMMVLAAAATALLAGLGLDAWREARSKVSAAVTPTLAVLGTVAALGAVAAALRPEWFAPLLDLAEGVSPGLPLRSTSVRLAVTAALAGIVVGLVRGRGASGHVGPLAASVLAGLAVADLAVYHRTPNPVAPARLYTVRPEVLVDLGEAGASRVYVYDYALPGKTARYLEGRGPYALARKPADFSLDAASALGMQMSLASESPGRWGIAQAFNVDSRGLQAAPLARLTRLLHDVEETPAHVRLLRAGGVTHTLAFHVLPDVQALRALPGLFERPLLVARVEEPLPRCYVVGGARTVDDERASSLLLDEGFSSREEVLLAEGEEDLSAPAGFRGTCRVTEARATRVTLETEQNARGHVVLLDTWDPGWRVLVDGRAAPLRRANLAFRAVPLAEGRHVVELTYRPRSLDVGLLLTVLSASALALLLVRRAQGPRDPLPTEAGRQGESA
jgi:hypothetical protein